MNKNHGYCSVHGCQTKKNAETSKHLSFFSLPREEDRRNEWLKIIGRTDLMDRSDLNLRSHTVCSIHFERNVILQRQYLSPDAIPTKYLSTIPSSSTCMPERPELETNTKDASTQTDFSQLSPIEINKNATSKEVSVQSNEENINLSTNSPRKRSLLDKLKESEQKRRRLELELKKYRERSAN